MKTKRIVFNVIFFSLFWSLSGCEEYPESVNRALNQAMDNKSTLIKVLDYYKGSDSLKFEAACFLISNMPYHYSFEQEIVNQRHINYFHKVDSLYHLIKNDLQIVNKKVKTSSEFYDSVKLSLALEFESISLLSKIINLTILYSYENHFYHYSFSELYSCLQPSHRRFTKGDGSSGR